MEWRSNELFVQNGPSAHFAVCVARDGVAPVVCACCARIEIDARRKFKVLYGFVEFYRFLLKSLVL